MTDNERLIYASRNGDIVEVKRARENGADVHTDNDLALRLASCDGNLDVVKYLRKL